MPMQIIAAKSNFRIEFFCHKWDQGTSKNLFWLIMYSIIYQTLRWIKLKRRDCFHFEKPKFPFNWLQLTSEFAEQLFITSLLHATNVSLNCVYLMYFQRDMFDVFTAVWIVGYYSPWKRLSKFSLHFRAIRKF